MIGRGKGKLQNFDNECERLKTIVREIAWDCPRQKVALVHIKDLSKCAHGVLLNSVSAVRTVCTVSNTTHTHGTA